MIHYGKNPDGELEIRAGGSDIGVIYRAIAAAHLPERGALYALKTAIERDFREEISKSTIKPY